MVLYAADALFACVLDGLGWAWFVYTFCLDILAGAGWVVSVLEVGLHRNGGN